MSTPQPPYNANNPYGYPPQSPGTPESSGAPQPPGGYPSQGYGAPQPPYGYPPQNYSAPQPKKRPSGWWFAPGVVALILAAVLGIFAGITVAGTFHTDGYVDADGTAQQITLDESGTHMLFVVDGQPDVPCSVTEAGTAIPVRPVNPDNSASVEISSGEWVPFAEFRSSSTAVEVTCEEAGSRVRVGAPFGEDELLKIGGFGIGAFITGLIGTAILLTVGILFYTRRPKPQGY